MNPDVIIKKKEQEEELTKKELTFMIEGYIKEQITKDEMTRLLKAIIKNDLTKDETFFLTDIFINSGDQIKLNEVKGNLVDKHSTGGVGDKTTLIVAPLVAASGSKIAKMSGKSLGHTGGTIDKLTSIPGLKTEHTKKEIIDQINKIGVVLSSQTNNLVPADKKIYALRDETNTVDNIGLISSSIMSKKIASGSDQIILDVKVGSGAFMKTIEEARKLATTMTEIGKNFKRPTKAILSNMNEPLGYNVGNSLEIKEAISVLEGKGEPRLKELCLTLAAHMVSINQKIDLKEARVKVETNLANKKALDKFKELVKAQGGDLSKIKEAKYKIKYYPKKKGFITEINTKEIGDALNLLIKKTKDNDLKLTEGIIFNKKLGDKVNKEHILTIHTNKKDIDDILDILNKAILITKTKPALENIIYEVI